MIGRFSSDENGAVAIEFAATAPILIFTAISGIVISMAIWQWNNLQGIAADTARCVALKSAACQTLPAGCTAGDPGICYAVDRAKSLSFDREITESNINISQENDAGGTSVVRVSIAQPFKLLSSSFTLNAEASFPAVAGVSASPGGETPPWVTNPPDAVAPPPAPPPPDCIPGRPCVPI